MSKITHVVGIVLIFCAGTIMAQTAEQDRQELIRFNQGITSYNHQLFDQARSIFESLQSSNDNIGIEAFYYKALIDLMVDQQPTTMIDFIAQHKSHPNTFNGRLMLGTHYANNGEYYLAIERLENIHPNTLSTLAYAKVRYQLGYSHFMVDHQDEALMLFKEVINFQQEHVQKAHYYSGIVEYKAGNLSTALDHFTKAEESVELIPHTAVYVANTHFKNKSYRQLIQYIDQRETLVDKAAKGSLLRLKGEAYFVQEDYRQAANAFTSSLDYSGKADHELYYRLAYAFDQVGDDNQAIENYKVAGLAKSATGQLAAFRLGELYLDQENYEFAANAFESAVKANQVDVITEQSHFLMAKCLMGQQLFDQAIEALIDFDKTYPNSQWRKESVSLLASSYFQTSNYDAAIKHLESSDLSDRSNQSIYQQVTFLKGQQLFNDGDSRNALILLDNSLKYRVDRSVEIKSVWLKGECYSNLENWENARRSFETVRATGTNMPEGYLSNFGLGYALYQLNDYGPAIRAFDRFLQRAPNQHPYQTEALIRKADCYFALKDYDEAIDVYWQTIGPENQDYAVFQIGRSHYFNEDRQQAINQLKGLIQDFPNSYYRKEALILVADIYVKGNENELAEIAFTQFIDDFAGSEEVPNTRLQRGLNRIVLKRQREASDDFIYLIENHPQKQVAQEALLGLQQLIDKGYEVAGFDQYLSKLKSENQDNVALINIAYERAKSFYFAQSYERCIESLRTFIAENPGYGNLAEAHYYLADSYYREGEWRSAADNFRSVGVGSRYTNRSLNRMAIAFRELGEMNNAKYTYQELLSASQNSRERYQALEGLMQVFNVQGQTDSVRYYADQIIGSDWKPLNAALQSKLFIGKSFLKDSSLEKASKVFTDIVEESADEFGAEAAFNQALIARINDDYITSNELAIAAISKYGSYGEWTDEYYLLLVDNYISTNELLQAKATLESIIDKSKNEELIRRANEKLAIVTELEQEILTVEDVELDSVGNE
ncbi:MAG: tetratricopeptide repeat protein [Cyclobacteriaceae bacterium]